MTKLLKQHGEPHKSDGILSQGTDRAHRRREWIAPRAGGGKTDGGRMRGGAVNCFALRGFLTPA